MRSGPSHFYYIFDALGSVIALTDSSGAIAASYSYDSYGNTVTASGAQASVNPFRFASGYFDSATGLLKFGTRYYDPSLGRWTQRDSIAGSIADPGNLNRYVYAGDSPVSLTDVSGMQSSLECVYGVIGAAGLVTAAGETGLAGGDLLLLSAEIGGAALFGGSLLVGIGLVGVVAAGFTLVNTCPVPNLW